MNNGSSRQRGVWPGLRRRLVPLLAWLALTGALLHLFLALRATVWCTYTDDVSIRENALDAKPRLVIWEEPRIALGARDASAVAQKPAFSPDGAALVFSSQSAGATNAQRYACTWDGRTWSKPAPSEGLPATGRDTDPGIARNGRYIFFASDRPGGYGGFDIYGSRVIRGERQPAVNLGLEINSPADDLAPAARMEGFDLVYSSGRGAGGPFQLYSTTAREVVGQLDLSRLDALIERLLLAKWWMLAFVLALLLLIYLSQHYRDLTNLFHKLIVHLLALLVVSSWKIHAQMAEKAAPTNTVEVAISVDTLAGEKMAQDLAENVMGRVGGGGGDGMPQARAEITVVARQADSFMPLPDFQPRRTESGPMVVARSTVNPVALEDAPSRAQESSGGRAARPAAADQTPVKLAAKLELLLEVAAPRVDIVMEQKAPAAAAPVTADESAFQPLMNAPTVSTARVQIAVGAVVGTSPKPVALEPDVSAVAVVTNTAGENSSLADSRGSGTGAMNTLATGGSVAVLSRGGDASSGPRALGGLGTVLTARLASMGGGSGRGEGRGPGLGSGVGGGIGSGVSGKLEEPDHLNVKLSPYVLRKDGKPSSELVEGLGGSQETETAVIKALVWLARHQEPDGRWSIQKYGGKAGHDQSATGLALLCFLGRGAKPMEAGPYQVVMAKALAWLSAQVRADGDARGAGNMYDQGIATIALAESYALTKDPALSNTVNRAVGFIVQAQQSAGGWRYKPGEAGDTSVFGWQLMALMSARMAGLHVPQATVTRADQWLTTMGGGERGGLYGYSNRSAPTPSMAAEGMFCRQIMGALAEEDRMVESAGYLFDSLPPVKPAGPSAPARSGRKAAVRMPVDFYYLYYGTLAMNQHRGPAWDAWNERLKLVLPPLQAEAGDEAGSWAPAGQHGNAMGRVVSTALAALSLEVYYRYLPFAFTKGMAAATIMEKKGPAK
ncbi:MAG: hypothetical protein NTV49_15895 [Kiritimatiellaeota bacterium]|nr:hypothetical protein [Kiritimatiellota bacterium]